MAGSALAISLLTWFNSNIEAISLVHQVDATSMLPEPSSNFTSEITSETHLGYVTSVEVHDLPTFRGAHALVDLRDSPGTTVAVLTEETRLQSILESALISGNRIQFYGHLLSAPPTLRGETWSVQVYQIDGVILFNMK
jgi:hypothetical protein